MGKGCEVIPRPRRPRRAKQEDGSSAAPTPYVPLGQMVVLSRLIGIIDARSETWFLLCDREGHLVSEHK